MFNCWFHAYLMIAKLVFLQSPRRLLTNKQHEIKCHCQLHVLVLQEKKLRHCFLNPKSGIDSTLTGVIYAKYDLHMIFKKGRLITTVPISFWNSDIYRKRPSDKIANIRPVERSSDIVYLAIEMFGIDPQYINSKTH